jgi:hypothetical protein
MVPDRIIHPEPHEPAEQKVELHPLHQLALRAHPIEGLQQHRPQQFLRRNRRPPEVRIEPGKVAGHIAQCRVRDLPDRPQRMVPADPRLKIDVAE